MGRLTLTALPLALLFNLAACAGQGAGDAASTTGSSKQGWTRPADPERVTNPAPAPEDVAALVAGDTSFAVTLSQQLGKNGGNAVVSPYGASLNLAELDSEGVVDPTAT